MPYDFRTLDTPEALARFVNTERAAGRDPLTGDEVVAKSRFTMRRAANPASAEPPLPPLPPTRATIAAKTLIATSPAIKLVAIRELIQDPEVRALAKALQLYDHGPKLAYICFDANWARPRAPSCNFAFTSRGVMTLRKTARATLVRPVTIDDVLDLPFDRIAGIRNGFIDACSGVNFERLIGYASSGLAQRLRWMLER